MNALLPVFLLAMSCSSARGGATGAPAEPATGAAAALAAVLDKISGLPASASTESSVLDPATQGARGPRMLQDYASRWDKASMCGVEYDGLGRAHVMKPSAKCHPACVFEGLAAAKDLAYWSTPGDAKRAATIEAACAATTTLSWIPEAARETMRPADLMGLVLVLEPAARAATTDAALTQRLNALAQTLSAEAVAGREDGLASEVAADLMVLALGGRSMSNLSMRLATTASGFGLPGRPLRGLWWSDTGDSTDEQQALALLRSGGGACADASEGPALADELVALPPAQALSHLLARCDARGPDPFLAPVSAEARKGYEEAGLWPEPAARRASTWWGTLWLGRTAAEPVLVALTASHSPASLAVADALRASLVALLPERPTAKEISAVRDSVAKQAKEGTEKALEAAVGGLSSFAAHARVAPGIPDFQGRASWMPMDDLEAGIRSDVPEIAVACPEGAASGCASRALLTRLAPPIVAYLQAEPGSEAGAAQVQAILASVGVRSR